MNPEIKAKKIQSDIEKEFQKELETTIFQTEHKEALELTRDLAICTLSIDELDVDFETYRRIESFDQELSLYDAGKVINANRKVKPLNLAVDYPNKPYSKFYETGDLLAKEWNDQLKPFQEKYQRKFEALLNMQVKGDPHRGKQPIKAKK